MNFESIALPHWYLTPVVNFGEVLRAQLAKSTLLTSSLVPLVSFQIFKVSSDAKERVGCGKQQEATYLSIPSKTTARVPEFAVEDLPLSRTVALVPEFAAKDLSLGSEPWKRIHALEIMAQPVVLVNKLCYDRGSVWPTLRQACCALNVIFEFATW